LYALPQFSGSLGRLLSSQEVFVIVILIIALVIAPAVWSTRPSRQRAALAILDRLATLLVSLVEALLRVLHPKA
jgi:hypothetical protein